MRFATDRLQLAAWRVALHSEPKMFSSGDLWLIPERRRRQFPRSSIYHAVVLCVLVCAVTVTVGNRLINVCFHTSPRDAAKVKGFQNQGVLALSHQSLPVVRPARHTQRRGKRSICGAATNLFVLYERGLQPRILQPHHIFGGVRLRVDGAIWLGVAGTRETRDPS